MPTRKRKAPIAPSSKNSNATTQHVPNKKNKVSNLDKGQNKPEGIQSDSDHASNSEANYSGRDYYDVELIPDDDEQILESVETGQVITEVQGDLFDVPDGSVLIHACNCQGVWGSGVAKEFKERYPAAFAIYRKCCEDNPRRPRRPSRHLWDRNSPQVSIEATCLLIPPQKDDFNPPKQTTAAGRAPRGRVRGRGRGSSERGRAGRSQSRNTPRDVVTAEAKRHWIACLFTSWGYGRNHASKDMILDNTRGAIEDMCRKLYDQFETQNTPLSALHDEELNVASHIQRLFACRINSGKFKVKWADTKAIMEEAIRKTSYERNIEPGLGIQVTVVRQEGEPLEEETETNGDLELKD